MTWFGVTRARVAVCFVASALVGGTVGSLNPLSVSAGSSAYVSVAAGEDYGLALRTDGTVLAWGDNSAGQLGNGTTSPYVTTPTVVAGLSNIVQISAGYWTSLALTSDGTVWAWGYNPQGEVGSGAVSTTGCYCTTTPTQVLGLSGVTAVAAGGDFMGALKSDGTVWEWGMNVYGEVGSGTPSPRSAFSVPTAQQVVGLSGVTALALGYDHTVAVRSDGSVWTWGSNFSGELGNGTVSTSGCTCVATPAPVPGVSGARSPVAALSSSLVINADGTVWTWGLNQDGQLGTGGTASTPTPAQVPGLSNVTAASGHVNGFSYLAVLSSGSVVGWGYSGDGELLNNTTTPRLTLTPTAASGLPRTAIVGVAAGDGWSMALVNDGTAWSAGWNAYGQLGQGYITVGGSCRCAPTVAQSLVALPATATAGLRNVNTRGDIYFDNTFTPGQGQQLDAALAGPVASAYLYVDGQPLQAIASSGRITWTPPNNPDGTPLFTTHTLVIRGADQSGNPVSSQTLQLYALVEVQADAVSILPSGAVRFNPFSTDVPFTAHCLDVLPATGCAGQPPAAPALFRMLNRVVLDGKSNGSSFIEPLRSTRSARPGDSFYCNPPASQAALRTNTFAGPLTDPDPNSASPYTAYISTLETRVNVTTPDVFRVPTPPGTTGPTNQSDFVPWIFSSLYAGISASGHTTVRWADQSGHASYGNSLFPYHYLYKNGALVGPLPHPTPDLVAWTRTAALSPQRILDALATGMGPFLAPILQRLLNNIAPDVYATEHLFAAERAECARQRFATLYPGAGDKEDWLQHHFPGLPLWAVFAISLKGNVQPHYNAHEFAQGVAQAGFVRDPGCVVPGCPGLEHMKVIGVFSPVSVDVYDAAGHHSGPLPDGTIEQGIDAVTYLTVGHGTFLIIPNDSSYRVQLTGTGSGVVTLNAMDFNGQSKLEFEQYSNVPVTPNSQGKLVMGAAGTPFTWDPIGSGNQGQMTPTTLTTSSASDTSDITPPTTAVTLAGTAGQPGYYRSPVDATFVGHDDLSGVGQTDYSLDGGATWTPYTTALHFAVDGSYHLLYRSTDYAGNKEQSKAVSFVIDTVPPSATGTASPQPPPPGRPTVTLQISSLVITPGGALPQTTCWVTNGVNVALSAIDSPGGSGVQRIDYTLAGAQTGSGTLGGSDGTVAITAAGTTTVTYVAIDRAGNRASAKAITAFLAPDVPIACAPAPSASSPIPIHGTISVTGTVTVNGQSTPFSTKFSF